jgi:hypothetical protein
MQNFKMRLALALLFLASLSYCSQKENRINTQVRVSKKPEPATINYDSCKNVIRLTKKDQKARWPGLSKTEKEEIFTSAVTETIIPAWIGTGWDFNGITEKPQQGSIACGYFVTTIHIT